jgi:hypothetical protein
MKSTTFILGYFKYNGKFWRKEHYKAHVLKSLVCNSEENSLNLSCSEPFFTMLEAEFEEVPERKVVAKCQVYNFYVGRF